MDATRRLLAYALGTIDYTNQGEVLRAIAWIVGEWHSDSVPSAVAMDAIMHTLEIHGIETLGDSDAEA